MKSLSFLSVILRSTIYSLPLYKYTQTMAYDIFISYRRKGGADKARPLKSELERRGYNVFLDFDELKDGVFDQRIMDAIDEAPIFLVILSAHSLDRCKNDNDWVRKEIEYAISKRRHFVPVDPNKEFDGFPADIPESVKLGLGQHQFSHVDFEQLFKASIDKMVSERIEPFLSQLNRLSTNRGALVNIETDIDCRILRFGKEIAVAHAAEFSSIRLPKGKHKLAFIEATEGLERYECLLDIKDVEYEDFIEVKLLDKYNARKTAELADQKVKKEAERKASEEATRRAKAEAERKAREEAIRRAKEEAERKAHEEAARRAKEEAERKAREEAARPTYKVGDYYNDGTKEGVVFEVSADGKHGKIVSMTQSRGELQWTLDMTELERLIGADSKTDGAYNMAKVKAVANWQSKYPAFKWCADLGEGWYLPSLEELKRFTLDNAVHDAVNRTLISKGGVKLFNRGSWELYWSSTEYNRQYRSGEFCAWYVGMIDGYTYSNLKISNYCVRAVSAF